VKAGFEFQSGELASAFEMLAQTGLDVTIGRSSGKRADALFTSTRRE
jgi:hypothetical protein